MKKKRNKERNAWCMVIVDWCMVMGGPWAFWELRKVWCPWNMLRGRGRGRTKNFISSVISGMLWKEDTRDSPPQSDDLSNQRTHSSFPLSFFLYFYTNYQTGKLTLRFSLFLSLSTFLLIRTQGFSFSFRSSSISPLFSCFFTPRSPPGFRRFPMEMY